MLITQITLDNIKSYKHAVIHLDRGTTAIRGHNGAGKSTLVEAIGYALCDFLPYSPAARFIREGEKSGKVVVAIVSALDERAYDIERRISQSGSGAWFAFDPELGKRVVEGKEDMLAFLREHLGVQTTLPLADLYDNAIAVQQGTFTADFLQTAGARKNKFDKLLQVEDYTQAFTTLRETVSHLKDTIATSKMDSERLTAQTADLPVWCAERLALHAAIASLSARIAQIITDRLLAEGQRDAALARHADVTRLDSVRLQAQSASDLAHMQWRTAQDEADRAAEAHARCEAALADHQRHLAATTALALAQTDLQTASGLDLRRVRAEQALASTREQLAQSAQRLTLAHAAVAERDRLVPLVARQLRWETQLQAARVAQQQLSVLQRELAQMAQDLQTHHAELQHTADEIARLDAMQSLAEALTTRRATHDLLRQEDTARAERITRLQALEEQIAHQLRSVSTAEAAATAAQAHVAHTQALLAHLTELPDRENELAKLDGAIATLAAEIKHAEQSMHASQGGACPFLKEPCLNMKQRGLASLDDYFGALIFTKMDALHPLEQERKAAQARLTELRAQQAQVDQLPTLAHTAHLALAMLQDQQTELARRQREAADLAATVRDPALLKTQLAEAEKLLRASSEADRLRVQLPSLRSRHSTAQEQIQVVTQRQAAREQDRAAAHTLASQALALTNDLRDLGDPRQQHGRQDAQAQQLPTIQAEVARHEATIAATATELAQVRRELVPFAGLAERITTLQTDLQATAAAHATYLRHEALAARLPAARTQAAAALAQCEQAEVASAVARHTYAAAAALFDPAALAAAQQRLHDLNAELGMVTAQTSQARDRVATLDAIIAEGETRLVELADIQAARDEQEATQSHLNYFRDTIKEAGPYVMRALLREISSAANTIFGEIIGDRSATLTWQEDYDIVLRTSAYERHFAQLSGGEQMSAALAVRLALLRTLTRATVAFFDEPTQNMDDERRTNLAAQIQRVRGFEQLVVISHDDTFEEGLDSVIWVRKQEGESQVESDAKAITPLAAFAFPHLLGA